MIIEAFGGTDGYDFSSEKPDVGKRHAFAGRHTSGMSLRQFYRLELAKVILGKSSCSMAQVANSAKELTELLLED